MFVVILASHVERETFNSLLDAARSLGGWYSRKWGTTPAGFAFKTKEQAEQFAAGITIPKTEGGKELPQINPAKLREMAEKLQPTIDAKLSNRLANTPKREANH